MTDFLSKLEKLPLTVTVNLEPVVRRVKKAVLVARLLQQAVK